MPASEAHRILLLAVRHQRSGRKARAIERRADRVAIGEDDRGGAVPRLDRRNVRVVVGTQTRVAFVDRGREQHVDALVDAVARADHRIDRGIEIERVARARIRFHATRFEPRAIARDRVDLAVVRDVPERLHESPRGRTIGRKALMEEREPRRERLVAQVVEIRAEFVGRE